MQLSHNDENAFRNQMEYKVDVVCVQCAHKVLGWSFLTTDATVELFAAFVEVFRVIPIKK